MSLDNDDELKGKVICKYTTCEERGVYKRCYLHLYSFCPNFKTYFNGLTDEQKDILFNPRDFDLT